MASRTGILSDDHFDKNCFEYSAMPMGYAQVHKIQLPPNPLPGIKPSKYPVVAPRPQSADVVAVNASMGNEKLAGDMLHAYNQSAKEYVHRVGGAPIPELMPLVATLPSVEPLRADSLRGTYTPPPFTPAGSYQPPSPMPMQALDDGAGLGLNERQQREISRLQIGMNY